MPRTSDIKGFNVEVGVGQTQGTAEWELTESVDLYGMILFPLDAKFGDAGKIEVVHPTAGTIATYGEDVPIPPVEKIDVEGEPGNAVEIPAGLTLKFTYTAIDTVGRKCILWAKYKRQT